MMISGVLPFKCLIKEGFCIKKWKLDVQDRPVDEQPSLSDIEEVSVDERHSLVARQTPPVTVEDAPVQEPTERHLVL